MNRYIYITMMFLLTQSCAYKSELPILSYKIVDGKKEYYKINQFEFLNQENNIVNATDTKGTVHTINFFFTSCPSICPPMRLKQLELSDFFKDEKKFKQYSISIDLKRDDIQKLKYYASISGIDTQKWNLLKAKNHEDLLKMAELLKTNFKPNDDNTDFYHSSYLALLDKNHQIRGFYNILSNHEFELLKQDITDLLHE